MNKQKLFTTLAVSLSVFLSPFSTGFASERSLEILAPVEKAVIASGPVRLTKVEAIQGDDFVIKGKLRKITHAKLRGHVDFAAYDKSGKLVEKGSVSYFPSLLAGKSRKDASFRAILDNIDKDVASVAVAYHGKGYRATGLWECDDNKAVERH